MSDHRVFFIPENPHFLPDKEMHGEACSKVNDLFPEGDGAEAGAHTFMAFFDCGENFGRICCPTCNSEIELSWWQERMSEDNFEGEFLLNAYPTPCCQSEHNLNKLEYDWPQGFARFRLCAFNPNVENISDGQKAQLEEILGTPLRVIHQHL